MFCAPQATEDDKRDAVAALTKYDMLVNHEQRQRFLLAFRDSGNGKQPGALKFVHDFTMSVISDDTTEISSTADYYTVSQILQRFGRSVGDFASEEEAAKDVEYLVNKNAEDHSWSMEDHPPKIDTQKPLYSKYWYVWSNGKTEAFVSTQRKVFKGEAQLKSIKQLDDAMSFADGLGFQEQSSVDIENAKHAELLKSCCGLKYSYIFN